VRNEKPPEHTIHDSNATPVEESHTDSTKERAGGRSTASHAIAVKKSARAEAAKRRVVVEPTPPQPAPPPSAEPAATPVTVGEAPQGQGRPLFDFFGLLGGHQADDQGAVRDRDGDVREQDGAMAAPSASPPAGRNAQVNGGKSRLVRQQQQRRVIIDQSGEPLPPDSDDGPGRWGGGGYNGDNWHHDDGWHRGWNDNRDDGNW
jgi:hypothetical protein